MEISNSHPMERAIKNGSPSQAYITVKTNLSVNVLPPLSALEIFKEIWTNFGDVISLISGGFAENSLQLSLIG